MPSRKQRRRRAKERRHEYEYVYVDEEGNEVEVDPAELSAAKTPKRDRQTATRSTRTPIQPPSWRRVGRRGLILAPLMFITVHVLGGLPNIAAEVFQTIFLMAFFLPFSYLMDSFLYRRYMRRTGQEPATDRR